MARLETDIFTRNYILDRPKKESSMILRMDSDVRAVLEFMQSRIPTQKLVAVADSLPVLAKSFWGHYRQESVVPLSLVAEPPCSSCEKQPSANECVPVGAYVDGGSGVEANARTL
jgi:hypothetical protein